MPQDGEQGRPERTQGQSLRATLAFRRVVMGSRPGLGLEAAGGQAVKEQQRLSWKVPSVERMPADANYPARPGFLWGHFPAGSLMPTFPRKGHNFIFNCTTLGRSLHLSRVRTCVNDL